MAESDKEQALEVANVIGTALGKLKRLNARVHAQSGNETSGFMLLFTLANHGPSRSNALAEAVHADPSTVSRQVAQLVKDGLVRRQADSEDGRAIVLALTEAGQDFVRRSCDRRNAALADMIAYWPEHERTQFAQLFARFSDDYERHLPVFIAELNTNASSGGEK